MAQDITAGLRMMASEWRRNAERATSSKQQQAMAGRAMLCESAANEIEQLRKTLSSPTCKINK